MSDKIIQQIEQKGYKITSQRVEIINTLVEKANTHPTLKKVYETVKKKLTRMSFSTLYNNILKLESLGVLKLFTINGESRIEMNTKTHLNIIQPNNSEIVDITDDKIIEDFLKRLKIKKEDHNLILMNLIFY